MPVKVNTNYIALYDAAASLIPQDSKIIEIGCGEAPFVSYLGNKINSYVGIDKDVKVIERAAEICRHNSMFQSGAIKFLHSDVMGLDFLGLKGRTVIALEVFEHILQDLAVLHKFHKGTRVIMSVPSFNSEDHERFFPEEHEALERYSRVLDIDFWRKIKIPTGGGYFHLMRGYR